MEKIRSSEITPEKAYLSRRQFIGLGALAATAALLEACSIPGLTPPAAETLSGSNAQPAQATTGAGATPAAGGNDELGSAFTSYDDITHYNNYYEFSMDKEGVAPRAKGFKVAPWNVAVGGLVNNPKTWAVEDLLAKFPQEERIYRLRCVEAWSMVIPWQGFPLGQLLREADPMAKAKYVRFETVMDPMQMPGQRDPYYPWPYTEGLRVDEAMNDLAILASGLYGKTLLPQNGAPLRLVVPWKYGFKSLKAIVKIDLVEEQPRSLWMAAAPNEYGFYANVNPDVSHPRWSQASERRIGDLSRRKTLPFNGYAEQVGQLYQGMDLRANY